MSTWFRSTEWERMTVLVSSHRWSACDSLSLLDTGRMRLVLELRFLMAIVSCEQNDRSQWEHRKRRWWTCWLTQDDRYCKYQKTQQWVSSEYSSAVTQANTLTMLMPKSSSTTSSMSMCLWARLAVPPSSSRRICETCRSCDDEHEEQQKHAYVLRMNEINEALKGLGL